MSTQRPRTSSTHGLSRRSLLAVPAVAAGVALGVRAGFAQESSPVATPAADLDRFPVEIAGAFGTATIPAAPERLVTLGWTDVDVALALGVVPVGIYQFFASMSRGVGVWAEPLLGDADPHIFPTGEEIDLEAVVALQPDLISAIESAIDAETYERYAAVAPTLGLPEGATPYGVPWQETTRTLARGLGRSADGERLISETEDLLSETAATHPEFAGKTATVVLAYEDKLGFWTTADNRVQLVTALGFTPSQTVQDAGTDTFFEEISLERTQELEADVVIFLSYLSSTLDELKEQYPTVAAMRAVAEGRAIAIDDEDLNLGLSIASVLSIPFAIDGLARRLNEIIPA